MVKLLNKKRITSYVRMEFLVLKNILVKQKKEDIFHILELWGFLRKADIEAVKENVNSTNRTMTKSSLSATVAEVCQDKGGLSMESIGELDLLCMKMNAGKKVWSAYQLTKTQGSKNTRDVNSIPAKIKAKIKKQMRNYFTEACSVSLLLLDGLLWGRMYLPMKGRKGYQPTRCLYFIYYLQSPVIVFNGMKVAFEEFISQCLVVALGYKELKYLDLTGHHYPSLAELAFNKYAEGGFSKYQQTQSHNGTLNEVTSQKRKAEHFLTDDNIIDVNRAEKRMRLDVLEKNFGEYVMPTIEKVEYRVQLPYKSKHIVPHLCTGDETFRCKIKFSGTSVLEGLRNLATAGYATLPLPNHLTCVTTRARNKFLLAKPPKNADKSQNASQNQTAGR